MQNFLDGRVIVKVGDLTLEEVDAIVNAADPSLLGGGGVDGAIHARGGPSILEECKRIRAEQFPDGLPTGEAVITTAGDLPSRFVIHTVGPICGYNNGLDAELLAASYLNSLQLAAHMQIATVAFPSISTGAFGYPKSEAAVISSTSIAKFLSTDTELREVRLVFHTAADSQVFLNNATFPN